MIDAEANNLTDVASASFSKKNIFISIRDYLGYGAPYILFVSSLFLLSDKWIFLTYYVIGWGISMLLNFCLKALIKQPRPNEDSSLFDIKIKHGKRISFDKYGMPSGHAQHSFYSTMFISCALYSDKRLRWVLPIYLLLSLNTVYQRVNYKNHYFSQVAVGAAVGSALGYAMFLISKSMLYGKLRRKDDDSALL